jgi:F-type H+-transporting ATPase subunit b
MNLIDIRQVVTQVLGFLVMVWLLRRFAWDPVLNMLEKRRAAIAGEFQEADRRKADADQLKVRYEQELKTIDAQARQKLQEAVADGQRVASEIKGQANQEAAARLARSEDEIAREREKAKEVLKQQVIALSMRSAEKILRQKLDEKTQRQMVSEFIDEVGAIR